MMFGRRSEVDELLLEVQRVVLELQRVASGSPEAPKRASSKVVPLRVVAPAPKVGRGARPTNTTI